MCSILHGLSCLLCKLVTSMSGFRSWIARECRPKVSRNLPLKGRYQAYLGCLIMREVPSCCRKQLGGSPGQTDTYANTSARIYWTRSLVSLVSLVYHCVWRTSQVRVCTVRLTCEAPGGVVPVALAETELIRVEVICNVTLLPSL